MRVTECGQTRVLERDRFGAGEEVLVFDSSRASRPRYIDAQLIQLVGHHNLIVDRKTNGFALRAVAQRSIGVKTRIFTVLRGPKRSTRPLVFLLLSSLRNGIICGVLRLLHLLVLRHLAHMQKFASPTPRSVAGEFAGLDLRQIFFISARVCSFTAPGQRCSRRIPPYRTLNSACS
jgi:hypothetical protein